jgi:ADP-ribose pyrophosphatase YjhB (NUDIX family)
MKLRQRIRVAALIVRDERVLLVKHVDPESGFAWWTLPGGGVEGDESLLTAAKREGLEETGLTAPAERVVYLRDFIQPQRSRRFLEVIVLMGPATGELLTTFDSVWLAEARFFARDELASLTVLPELLRDQLWDDLRAGFPETRYLGVAWDETRD